MSNDERADRLASGSRLFILRLWLEGMGGGQPERRGRVQHVSSGEVRYFRDWPSFIVYFVSVVLR